MRHARTHWKRQHTTPPMTMCCRPLFTGGSHGRGVCYAEYMPEYVNCLVCLYHMGRYMPLVKLREHQKAQGMRPICPPVPVSP